MKAIITKYIPCSNVKGSRISAKDSDGNRVVISYPHEAKQGEDAHRIAAEALRDKMEWKGELIAGGIEKGNYVFVFIDNNISLKDKFKNLANLYKLGEDFVKRANTAIDNGMTEDDFISAIRQYLTSHCYSKHS